LGLVTALFLRYPVRSEVLHFFCSEILHPAARHESAKPPAYPRFPAFRSLSPHSPSAWLPIKRAPVLIMAEISPLPHHSQRSLVAPGCHKVLALQDPRSSSRLSLQGELPEKTLNLSLSFRLSSAAQKLLRSFCVLRLFVSALFFFSAAQ